MYDKFDKQKPFALLDTSKYPPEVAGRFNSFITTQFDDSLSVEMQMRSIIKWAIDNFKDMDQTYNDFTEYVIQGNLNPFIQFLNDLIEYMNNFIETFDEKYQETILDKMQEWYDNGELETLINESLNTKYHEMDYRLTTQMAQSIQQNRTYIDNQLNQLNGLELKGAYNTLQDLKNAYPNGTQGIFLVQENGHWYYWNDAWVDGGLYQATPWDEFMTENNEEWVI